MKLKLKKLKDKSSTDARPRWVWQLVWQDPASGREKARRIGYYCLSPDSWKPPGSRLQRLNLQAAGKLRDHHVQRLAEAREGIIIPAVEDTRKRWAEYCERTKQPKGLAFERLVDIADSECFRQFEASCRNSGVNAVSTMNGILSSWVARAESDAPETWDALTEWYRKEGSPNAGHRTWLESKTTFGLFTELCPELAPKWQALDRDDARTFQNRLTSRYKPMTVRKHLANMRKLWNACRQSWISGNPWSELAFPKAENDDEAWHCYTSPEVFRLLGAADLAWQSRIRLAWKGGLRPGEIDHLRSCDVDWAESRLRICRHSPGKDTLSWLPKDKDARSIPVDAETMGLLRKLAAKADPGNPYLFVKESRWRQAINRQNAGKWRPDMEFVCAKRNQWKAIVEKAGIKTDDAPPVFYSLRKTCCCDMLIKGVPPHEVQALLGHSSIKTTLTWYAKVNKADAERRIRHAQISG